jgi:hypothetical protein
MILNLIIYALLVAATLYLFDANNKLKARIRSTDQELYSARRLLEEQTKDCENGKVKSHEYAEQLRIRNSSDSGSVGKCPSPVKLCHTDIADASPNPLVDTFQQPNTHDDARPKKDRFAKRTHPLASAVTSSLPSTPFNHGGEGEQAVNRNAHMHLMSSCKEIYESLPSEGMHIQNLTIKFKGRVNSTNTQVFIKRVKAVSSFDKK